VWLVAGAATLAPFMEILDTTIVNVSLPNVAGALSASNDEATWTLTSYLVANGIVVPVAGWLGRLIGRKRYFLICIAMFTLCSFLCGIATSLPQLVVFRLLQGLFGGGLQPSQQSVILDTFEPSERGKGFSLVAIAVIFAPIIGPVLGGWLTDEYSWRWVFLINVPVGIFAFMAVAQLVEDPPWVQRDRAHLGDIDYVGLALIALGLGALQIMLDRGEDSDWFSSPIIQLYALLAAVGIIGGIAWLLMVEKPVVDLRCLKDRNFAVGALMISGIGAILYSTNVIIPVMAQQWLGYTALLAGLLLSPGAAAMIVFIPIVARLVLPNVQTRYVIAFGFTVLGCSVAYGYRLTPQMDFWTLASFRAFQMIAFGFLFVPNSTLSYSTLPRSLNPDATALYSMFRNIFGSIGIAVITALGSERQQAHRAYLAGHLTPYDQPYQELLSRHTQALQSMGHTPGSAHDTALGLINQTLNLQAAILSYMDLYAYTALAAFCLVPLTLLFRAGVVGRPR
jgi:MFS transporter, DHA2 family, multidrug resistance protein